MLYISFNYRELHRLKEAVFAPHMVNAGQKHLTDPIPPGERLLRKRIDQLERTARELEPIRSRELGPIGRKALDDAIRRMELAKFGAFLDAPEADFERSVLRRSYTREFGRLVTVAFVHISVFHQSGKRIYFKYEIWDEIRRYLHKKDIYPTRSKTALLSRGVIIKWFEAFCRERDALDRLPPRRHNQPSTELRKRGSSNIRRAIFRDAHVWHERMKRGDVKDLGEFGSCEYIEEQLKLKMPDRGGPHRLDHSAAFLRLTLPPKTGPS